MTSHYIGIKNIKGLAELEATFDFSEKDVVIITGKNGSGKTTLIKAFRLLYDLQVFDKTSNANSLNSSSSVSFRLGDIVPELSFSYNSKLKALDTKQPLPSKKLVLSELPIPFGNRFEQFSLVAKFDSDIRTSIASSKYEQAEGIADFLGCIYPESERFTELKQTKIGKHTFYFVLQENDYYIREDHFSSGEFFLIQLYRLVTTGAKLIVIDELDISLDASAQVRFLAAIKPILKEHNSKLIMVTHSLALMETANEGDLYYLERQNNAVTLEQRSFGYVKSDLYGFKGKDRYILTEDTVLAGFIEYLISASEIQPFFNYEIIPVGGEPQVKAMTAKNDELEIFGPSERVIVIIDGDIFGEVKRQYKGPTTVIASPVDDIELYIWQNREQLLPDVAIRDFTHAERDKDTAKTYWKKIISAQGRPESKKLFIDRLYQIIIDNCDTNELIGVLKQHLCIEQ